MIKSILKKISSLFYRAHLLTSKLAGKEGSFKPYVVKKISSGGKDKIIHANGNFVIGGSSQLIVDLVERSSDQFQHKIIVPVHPRPLPYQPLDIREFPLSRITQLYKYLREENPRLVHIHYWVRPMHRYRDFAIWYHSVFRVCEELKIPVIQNINVPTIPFESGCIQQNVFVSNYVRDNFNDPRVTSSVIYPGSDLYHFENEGAYEPVDSIGMVYRLDQDKLNNEAIDVFIQAVKLKPGLKCYIIGGGYYLQAYMEKVRKAGLKDNFIFPGFISYRDLPAWYKKIGLIVAPVHDESFGQVTVFAMAMGIPVAGYDTGALSEILGHKKTLTPYGRIKDLSELVISLVNDPGLRVKLGAENAASAKKSFSVENMIREYRSLYLHTLNPVSV
jgi:glycosyltransferase involved in cell wall biosynthesis